MPVEIERKYLVKPAILERLLGGSLVRQGYLETVGGSTVRARISGNRGYLTVKGPSDPGGTTRSEFEYEIPVADAVDIIDTLCGNRVLEKVRHLIPFGKHVWEVDVFQGQNSGLVVAEVELRSVDESFELPDWIDSEVTGNPGYYNRSLAEHPWPEWR